MLDLKEEQKYERLRKLGQELHIPIPEAFWTLEVFDKDGKLIQRHKQRSHSWVRNAYNVMFSQLAGKNIDGTGFGAGILTLKTTAGGVVSTEKGAGDNSNLDDAGNGYRAPAGEDAWGILVGSGINAEDFEDYVLQTPIAEGTGAGQLNHVLSEDHSISYAALVFTNVLIRYFNNNSGGNIDVNELALVFRYLYHGDILMARDHLASTVTAPDTGQLKVTYTIQLTYPA